MSMMPYTPIVECKYSWGRVLRLYRDGLSLEGEFYALSELERVYSTYHRVLGVSSARLELHFKQCCLTIPGIADVLLTQKIVDYITRWNAATEAINVRMVQNVSTPAAIKQLPASGSGGVSVVPVLHYSWAYDANDIPTTVDVIPAPSLTGLSKRASDQIVQSSVLTGEGANEEPWPAMPYEERMHRLRRLQAERELRVYGFDVQALSQHIYDVPLPVVLSPLNLLAGETAHYSIEANLSIESTLPSPRRRRRIKDRGKLVLTNKRLIYLGSKRQVFLAYEKVACISCVPGAIALDIEHVRQRQFFEMRRPLECSFYLSHLMEDARMVRYGQKVVSQAVYPVLDSMPRSPALPSDVSYQQSSSIREQDTLKLPVVQLYSGPVDDEDEDDTQKLVRIAGKSL